MTAQVAADLRAAADVLERDGWTQGRFYDRSTHARCAVGAIHYVVNHKGVRAVQAREAFADHVGEMGSSWNDAVGRTAAEVIAALRAAADRAEAEQ